MKVSVVITSYDGWRFLERCLPALLASRLPPGWELEPILVDNGSHDGTPTRVSSFPAVKAVIFDRALGYAGANNAARSAATGEVVVFLNNDTAVDRDWLLRPLQILQTDARVAGVGSKLVFMHRYVRVRVRPAHGGRAFVSASFFGGPLDDKVRWSRDAGQPTSLEGVRGRWVTANDAIYLPLPLPSLDAAPAAQPLVSLRAVSTQGPIRIELGARPAVQLASAPSIAAVPLGPAEATVRLIQNAGTYVTSDGHAGDFGTCLETGPGVLDREEVVPAICGAAFFARRPALDAAGWFPGYYHSYYEDVDLSLRLRRNGGMLVYCPSSIVEHYHTGTNRENSPGFIENVARSSLLFISQHGQPGVVGQRFVERAGHVARELLQGSRWPPALWRSAHGTRGAVKALPGLGAVALERSLRSLRGARLQPDLFSLPRHDYARPQGA